MERRIEYSIKENNAGITISSFLKSLGYSSQNLIQLKKQADSILINGYPCYMNVPLQAGDLLTVHIWEEISSEKYRRWSFL